MIKFVRTKYTGEMLKCCEYTQKALGEIGMVVIYWDKFDYEQRFGSIRHDHWMDYGRGQFYVPED